MSKGKSKKSQPVDPNAPRERRTLSGNVAIGFLAVAFVFLSIGMFTRCWLESESKAYGANVDSIGLWVQCLRSLTTTEDYNKEVYFSGCRWIFDPFSTDYDQFREMLLTPFFVTVQIFYTICFTLSLVGAALVGVLVLCPGEDFEPLVVKVAYIDCFVGWFFGFIAVIVFGAKGDDRDWMPHWEHNNLSWSYAFAVVGMVCQFVAGVLFWVESRIQKRKDMYRQSHGMFPMQTKQ